MRLTDAGYGSFNEVREFDVRTVIRMLEWIRFKGTYESTWVSLQKDKS